MSFFSKKKKNNKLDKDYPKVKCSDDPDCPMCHVSEEVIEQLKSDQDNFLGNSTDK